MGFSLRTAHKTMTSVATAAFDPPGLRASASRDARSGSPRQRLQKLLAVPGSPPSRVNDLLLLRADAEEKEKSGKRHVVFFHGDIQVSDLGVYILGDNRRN